MDFIQTLILGIMGGSGLAALINQAGEYLREKAKRKAESETDKDKDMEKLKRALKYDMLDRIRYLGQAYIRDGEIDYDDRRILHCMHRSYHEDLGGNGDLDTLMKEVDLLPLKVSK